MTDPYQILGVSPKATDEEIKAAYRVLARKYHPDNYTDNPLSDLASEKMQEVNAAYDQVMAQRRSGGNGNQMGSAPSQFFDIRKLIKANRITEAEELLDGVPRQMRDAEWHFLKGTVQHTRGWLDEAFENFTRACTMNPNNPEYQAARNQLEWQRRTGQPSGRGGPSPQPQVCLCGPCELCTSLYCAKCCCDCMRF